MLCLRLRTGWLAAAPEVSGPPAAETGGHFFDPLERSEDQNAGFFDQLFGSRDKKPLERSFPSFPQNQEKPKPQIRQEFSIFNRVDHHENVTKLQKEKELQELILKEAAELKKANHAVITEINNIEVQAMGSTHESSSEYNVRFLETLLSMLRLLRVRVSEAGSWLQAIQTKKAKRGSAHAVQKKSHDNLRDERKVARATQ